jgi:hypothetical protein
MHEHAATARACYPTSCPASFRAHSPIYALLKLIEYGSSMQPPPGRTPVGLHCHYSYLRFAFVISVSIIHPSFSLCDICCHYPYLRFAFVISVFSTLPLIMGPVMPNLREFCYEYLWRHVGLESQRFSGWVWGFLQKERQQVKQQSTNADFGAERTRSSMGESGTSLEVCVPPPLPRTAPHTHSRAPST